MSNLPKKLRRRREGVAKSTVLMVAVLFVLVAAMGVYFSNKAGVQQGRQDMQVEMQAAVDKAKAETQTKYDELSKQLADAQAKLKDLTPPAGPDPAVAPAHDAVFYAKALRDKVEAAKSDEERENVFWGSVCTTQQELVGAPVTVYDGARADTYREFVRNVDPYYYTLVVNKRVSFHTDSMLELGLHELQKQRDMEVNACS